MNISLLNQRYVPICKLGAGGMAEVFLARQTGEAGFQREVALKKIHHRLSDHPRAVRMFLDEAKLAAALCHPNIVQIYDVGREEKNFFIVMERVSGVDLRMLAERTTALGKMFPLDISLTIICQVLEGLCYAHTYHDDSDRPMAIVHGDIGPNNILIAYHGGVKLVDFGIARAEDQVRQGGGTPAGKVAYMSPEAVRGNALDARSDLFSVGILLYELTVGRRLFRVSSFESMRRILTEPIAPPTYTRPRYPADLENIVMRALELELGDRYATAEEMLEDLEEFAFNHSERLSRLRLSRFARRTMGVATSETMEDKTQDAPLPPPAELADLDFDNPGQFEDEEEDLLAEPPLTQQATQSDGPLARQPSRIMEAMHQADAAIAELEAASRTTGPREATQPEAEVSSVVVTEDLVEEELDADEPVLDLDRPKRRGFLDETLDADLDAVLEEEQEEDDELLLDDPTPITEVPLQREETRADTPAARQRTDEEPEEESAEELISALAEMAVQTPAREAEPRPEAASSAITVKHTRVTPPEVKPEPAAEDFDDDDDDDDITIDLDLEDLEAEELDLDIEVAPPEPPPIPQEPAPTVELAWSPQPDKPPAPRKAKRPRRRRKKARQRALPGRGAGRRHRARSKGRGKPGRRRSNI